MVRPLSRFCGRSLIAAIGLATLAVFNGPAMAQYQWAGGYSFSWGDWQNWNPGAPGQVPGIHVGGANVTILGSSSTIILDNGLGNNVSLGTLESSAPLAFSNITLALGAGVLQNLAIYNTTINTQGSIEINGTLSWTSGGFRGASGDVLTNGTVETGISAHVRWIEQSFMNYGTFNQGSTLKLYSGAPISNFGQWNFNGTNHSFEQVTGVSVFTNAGTVNSSSNMTVNCDFVNEIGAVVNVTAAELLLKRGGVHRGSFTVSNNALLRYLTATPVTIGNGAMYSGLGNVRWDGPVIIPANATVTANMDLLSTTGFQIGTSTGTLEGTLRNLGKLRYAGVLTGSGGIENEGDASILGGEIQATLVNKGSVFQNANTWLRGGTINLEHLSHWNMYNGHIVPAGGTTNNLFVNDGRFERTGADTTTLTIGVYTILNNGTFMVSGPGKLSLTAGGEFVGAGVFDVVNQTFSLDSGVYEVTGTPTIQGDDQIGRFNINAGATIKTVDGGTLTNFQGEKATDGGCYVNGKIVANAPGTTSGAFVNNGMMYVQGASIGSATEFGSLINDATAVVLSASIFGEFVNNDLLGQSGLVTLQNGRITNSGQWWINGSTVHGIGVLSSFENLDGGQIRAVGTSTIGSGSARLNNQGIVAAEQNAVLNLNNVEQVVGNQLNGGTWIVEASATMTFQNANIQEIGPGARILYNGGFVNNLQPILIRQGGGVSIGAATNLPVTQNSGAIDIQPGASLGIPGPCSNAGGSITLEGECDLNLQGPLNNEEDDRSILGQIDEVFVRTLTGGVLEPMITTPALNNNAILRPGGPNASGRFNLTGTLNQLANGRIHVELGGTIPVDEHDQMRIYNGDANLAGKLVIELLGKYAPESGQTFDVLTVSNGAISGTFSTLLSPPGHVFTASYLRDRVVLTYQGPAVPGDITGDGSVNVNDLLAVINAWGPCPAPPTPGSCPADVAPSPIGDGIVNVNDLLIVINNWG